MRRPIRQVGGLHRISQSGNSFVHQFSLKFLEICHASQSIMSPNHLGRSISRYCERYGKPFARASAGRRARDHCVKNVSSLITLFLLILITFVTAVVYSIPTCLYNPFPPIPSSTRLSRRRIGLHLSFCATLGGLLPRAHSTNIRVWQPNR